MLNGSTTVNAFSGPVSATVGDTFIRYRAMADVKVVTAGNYDVISVELVDSKMDGSTFSRRPTTRRSVTFIEFGLMAERRTCFPRLCNRNSRLSNLSAGDVAIHTFSTFNRVPITDVVRLPQHSSVRTLIDNQETHDRLATLKPTAIEFFKVDIGDGVQLDGWMIKPPDFDNQKRYPVLFFVYGEPWGQTVLDRWGGRDRMWHQMLAQQGYIVASVDSHGTPAPRGRAGERSSTVRWESLTLEIRLPPPKRCPKWPFVVPTRIGIWGWSGGVLPR
jgi:dipeptidyl-peptidase-4